MLPHKHGIPDNEAYAFLVKNEVLERADKILERVPSEYLDEVKDNLDSILGHYIGCNCCKTNLPDRELILYDNKELGNHLY